MTRDAEHFEIVVVHLLPFWKLSVLLIGPILNWQFYFFGIKFLQFFTRPGSNDKDFFPHSALCW